MTGPGAGAELKHLLNGVKAKTKPEGVDLKAEGDEAKALNLEDKDIDIKAETLSLKDKGLDLEDKGLNLEAETFNLKALGDAVKGAKTGNRQTIAVWSPEISAVLWYLKKTTPEFSISDEARGILENGLKKKYPELFKRIKKEMSQP